MPTKLNIQEGDRYGRLTVIKEVEPRKAFHGYERQFLCKCDCGNMIVTMLRSLRFERTTSCGCKQREVARQLGSSMRIYPDGDEERRIYSIWRGMKSRCYYKGNSSYARYGARGITVCAEWRNDFLSFFEWSKANGYKKGLTIDRIDNNGNYEPSNCRWVTPQVQSNNTRRNVFITHDGETHSISEWSRLTGINRTTLQLRVSRGCSDDLLFAKPIMGGARKKGQCYGREM